MNKILTFIFCVLLMLLASCGKDRSNEYYELTEENTWVYNEMKDKYLWGDDILEPTWKQYFGSTTRFFQTLVSSAGHNDLWSYCLPDSESVDPHARGLFNHLDTYGMDLVTMNDPTGATSRSLARVMMVVEGSPAYLCGIRRDDFIGVVDGARITSGNLSTTLQSGASHELEVYHLGAQNESLVWVDTVSVHLPASCYVEENAFPVYRCFTEENTNARVAYLMCARLVESPDEQNVAGRPYVERLDAVMREIKAFAPDEFVLDLRLCNYGTVEMAARLASAIVPADKVGATFCTTEWNSRYASSNRNFTYESSLSAGLNVNRLYFITGAYTQGASEWLISSLQTSLGADRTCVVGEKTKGQGIMTQLMSVGKGHHLYPAVALVKSVDGNSLSSGINPDTIVREQNCLSLHEYGKSEEPLLNAVLERISR